MMSWQRSLVLGVALVVGVLGVAEARDAGRGSESVSEIQSGSADAAAPGFLEQYAATYRYRLGRPSSITVAPDGSRVYFLRSGPLSFVRDLYVFETATATERVLLTAQQILDGAEERLTAAEKARRERQRMGAVRGISSYSLSEDGRRILVSLSGRLFIVDAVEGTTRELESEDGFPLDPRLSPNGRRLACVRSNDLYVTDLTSGKETRLTHDGGPETENGLAEFVAQEEMDRHEGYWWSPDSQFLVFQHTDTSPVELRYTLNLKEPSTPPNGFRYPRAGTDNAVVTLGILPVGGGETTWVQWDRERYPYLARVVWQRGGPLSILVQNRRQTEERLFTVDPEDGSTALVLEEREEAWLNLHEKAPFWLDNGQFLWVSEAGGTPQLELREGHGELLRRLVPDGLSFSKLLAVDLGRRLAYVAASEDPTQSHVWVLDLEGRQEPRRFSREVGLHTAQVARDGSTLVLSSHLEDGRRSANVLRRDGTRVGELKSVAEEPPFTAQVEYATVGSRQFRTALVRPRDFRAGRQYPVILDVYGGPGGQMVKRAAGYYLLNQWLADRGFVVVTIDGRGTPGRGRTWERAIKGNLIQIPLADQVEALQALGARYPELDLTRVGVFGWSFGGYFAAMAVMQRPDVFAAGVAGAPVADWEDYDTHYTERYLGLPEDNREGYADSNVLTHAPKLERPLLLIHGTMDDNVYFSHSMKISDALFRGGRTCDFLPLSGSTHGFSEPLVTERLYTRIVDFFREHLR